MSKNRKGNIQKFPLLSLSFAIVRNGNRKIFSYAHLASISSEVKKQAKALAKMQKTSVIFKDRRKDENFSDLLERDLNFLNSKIEILFQPVVDFLEGKVIGFEALVRGFSEENKLVSPYKLFEEA